MPKNFARHPEPWARNLDHSDDENPQRRGLRYKLDGRTKEGRDVKKLRAQLNAHVGPNPDAVTQIYVDQACALRSNIVTIENDVLAGRAGVHAQKTYLSWVNSFRRTLAQLRYGDAHQAVRRLAEATMYSAAARMAK
jgi:hypothetical protein